jgi:hypothetical protein
MKKVSKRIWVWILSGLTLIIGASNCAKVYGPPPVEEEVHDSLTR